VARIRQSRPDSGLGFQVKVLTTFEGSPSSLGSCQHGHHNVRCRIGVTPALSVVLGLSTLLKEHKHHRLVALIREDVGGTLER